MSARGLECAISKSDLYFCIIWPNALIMVYENNIAGKDVICVNKNVADLSILYRDFSCSLRIKVNLIFITNTEHKNVIIYVF